MKTNIAVSDLVKNRFINSMVIMFIATASTLVALASILTINLAGSIDSFMVRSQTPHFLQMHSGSYDSARMQQFAKNNDKIEKFQTIEFVNIANSELTLGGNILSGSMQDNGIVMQSPEFDFLLDLDGEIIHPKKGELYVPITYMKEGIAKIGDSATVAGRTLTVKGFLRDSQMNSQLSSSKRFLVSQSDFEAIKPSGSLEYLIEFRLKEEGMIASFTNDYTSAGLEANGPTITYPLFRMINAISDGILIGVLLFVSILVTLVSFLCIRFTLLAKIEEDTREIGVMKAIGLRTKDIKNVYLLTYAIIALLGAMSGYFISLVLQAPLVENIRLYMGDGFGAALGPAFALLGAAVVFIGVVIYTYVVLNRLKRISVSWAVRYGYVDEKVANPSFYQLTKRSFVKVNAFLGVKDIVSRKKMYVTMFIILVLGVLALALPLRLAMTLNDEQFVEYLGVGNSDVIFNVQQVDSVVMETNAVEKFLSTDRDVSLYTALTTKVFSAKTKNGEIASIKVELGDHRVFPINYVKGQAPTGQNEIALSVLSADDLRASVGDSIELHTNGNWRKLSVVGLYSDVTNGGKTAKANFVDSSASTMWSVVNVAFMDSGKVKEKAVEYTAKFPQVKVYDIEGYTRQMLGGIIDAVNSTVYLSAVVAVLLAFLITSMLMRMLTLKDRRSIAIMKALGFTARDIVRQYLYRSLFLLAVAVPLGLLLASTFGEWIVGVFMSQIGAVSVRLLPGWLPVILGIAVLVITVVMATRFGVRGSPKLSIADNIKE